jgi:hypothetical protein
MWSYEVWSELDAQTIRNCWRMARILLATYNVDFALVDAREKIECEKNKMNLVL